LFISLTSKIKGGKIMNRIVDSIIEEMELCYPSTWPKMSAAKRAQSIGKQFSGKINHMILSQKTIDEARAKAEIERAAIIEKRRARAAAAAKTRSQNYHKKWHGIITKAEMYYGDMMGEYAVSLWGEDGIEKMISGAEQLTADQEEECMSEALYATYCVHRIDDPKFYDRAIAYWKKYHR
jgi:hypothetical protein